MMVGLRGKSAGKLAALGLVLAAAAGVVSCTGTTDDPSPSETAAPSASASAEPSASSADLGALSDPDGPSFAELAAEDRSLDRFAAGSILVDTWESGPATWGDSCRGGGVIAYLTAPIEGPAIDLEVEVAVPDGVGYRVVVVEAEPGAQA